MERWEKMKVFRVVDFKPWIVNPLELVEKGGKLRLVLDATTVSGLNEYILALKFKLLSHSQIIAKFHSRG